MSDVKSLAVIDVQKQVILPKPDDLKVVFEMLSDMDRIYFGRIKVASGGVNMFMVTEPGAEEDTASAIKSIDAVIIANHKVNGYWPGSFGDDKVPACASMDGVTGVDRETGENIRCATCPFNAYGSGKDAKGNPGRGKACKNMQRLYLIRPGDALPLILTLPPTSLGAFDKYRTTLALAMKQHYAILTRFTLSKANNEDGTPYSKVAFEAVGVLPVAEAQRVKEYAEGITKAAARNGVTLDDYGVAEEKGEKVTVGDYDLDTATKERQQGIDFSKVGKAGQPTAEAVEAAIKAGKRPDEAIPADGFINVDPDELPFTVPPFPVDDPNAENKA